MTSTDSHEKAAVVRQPIWDHNRCLIGYELLDRSELAGHNDVIDGDSATTEVLINSLLAIGLERLVGRQPAYIRLGGGFIRGNYTLPLEPEQTVVEVPGDTEPDDAVVKGTRALRQRGFTVVLDDCDYHDLGTPLLALADRVKIDVQQRDSPELETMIGRIKPYGVAAVAKHVETHEAFEACHALGFDRFQGGFFCKPNIVEGQRFAGNRIALVTLLARLQDPTVDLSELEELIIQDVSLTYGLLRYVNSPAFGMSRRVETVNRAIALVGANRIRQWASLLVMTRFEEKPPELIRTALVRARMCFVMEQKHHPDIADQSFTVGLLSVLDALMNQPMAQLVQDLPLTEPVQRALVHHQGEIGELLGATIDYELGIADASPWPRLSPSELAETYVEALIWADAITDGLTSAA